MFKIEPVLKKDQKMLLVGGSLFYENQWQMVKLY